MISSDSTDPTNGDDLACEAARMAISAEIDGNASSAERAYAALHESCCGACANVRKAYEVIGFSLVGADAEARGAPDPDAWTLLEARLGSHAPRPAPYPTGDGRQSPRTANPSRRDAPV